MINIGRHPCNYDRLDFCEHETSDVGQGDCDMFSGTAGLFSLDCVSVRSCFQSVSSECSLTAEVEIIYANQFG